jgi:hypothetical protein
VLVEPERDALVLRGGQQLLESFLVPVDGDPRVRRAAAISRLDPVEVEQQGGRELSTCCRVGEFGPGNDDADRGVCRVVPDELGACE